MAQYGRSFYLDSTLLNEDLSVAFPRLMELAQEAGTLQTKAVGYRPEWFVERAQGWVIAKWDCMFFGSVEWGKNLEVQTWPSSFKGFVTERSYACLQAGEPVMAAQTLWVYSDLSRRRPVRPPKEIIDAYDGTSPPVLPAEYHIDVAEGEPDYTEFYTVRRTDIDLNHHVNNVKYLFWLYNCLSAEEAQTVRRLKVAYKRECMLGQHLKIDIFRQNGYVFAKIFDGDELTTEAQFFF